MNSTVEELHLVLHFELVPNATSQVVGSVGDPRQRSRGSGDPQRTYGILHLQSKIEVSKDRFQPAYGR